MSRGRVSQLLTSREEPSAHLIAKLLLLTRLPFHRLFLVTGEQGMSLSKEHKREHQKGKRNGNGVGHPRSQVERRERQAVGVA